LLSTIKACKVMPVFLLYRFSVSEGLRVCLIPWDVLFLTSKCAKLRLLAGLIAPPRTLSWISACTWREAVKWHGENWKGRRGRGESLKSILRNPARATEVARFLPPSIQRDKSSRWKEDGPGNNVEELCDASRPNVTRCLLWASWIQSAALDDDDGVRC